MHLSTYSPNFTPIFFITFISIAKPLSGLHSLHGKMANAQETKPTPGGSELCYIIPWCIWRALALTSQTLPKYSLHTYRSPWGIWGAFVSIFCFQKRFGIPETVPLLSASLTFPLIWFRKHLERALPPLCKLSQNDIYWMEMPCTALQQAHSYY